MGIIVKTSFQDQIGDLGKLYVKKEFTGGSSDALDSIDGSVLKNGVFALVLKDGKAYSMEYVEGAAGGEDPPNIVTPDSNPTGRWILRGIIYDTDASGAYAVSPTPEANEIPLLNNNGQLWLPLNRSPILISGQDMMSRTFYVDAENGDDNNDGSESAPFKTIKKACDSVPVGGYGYIYVLGDYTMNDESQITSIVNKKIVIELRGTFTFDWYVFNENEARLPYFEIIGSDIVLLILSDGNGNLVIEQNTTGVSTSSIKNFAFRTNSYSFNNNSFKIVVYTSEDNYNPMVIKEGILLDVGTGINMVSSCFFEIAGHYNGTNRQIILYSNTYLMRSQGGGNHYIHLNYAGGWKDEDGNNIDLTQKFDINIVKDTNNVPRNIVSNIIF